MIKKYWKTALKIAIGIFLIPVFFFLFVFAGVFGHVQTKAELLSFKNVAATIVLSSEGELIGKFYSENRTNTSYQKFPENLINALIATEDSRFYEHNGIDSRSLLRVLIKSILLNNDRSGGGSTISQQLAKNMFGREYSGLFSMPVIKTKESILANRLEKTFTKEEILTLYLNTVSFGENLFGIETAARQYFNKETEHLKTEESAVLVGILKANTFYNPHLNPDNALTRRNVVLKQMEKYDYLTSSEADSLCALPLKLNYADIVSEGPADYFLVGVKKEASEILQNITTTTGKNWNIEEDGLIITTTLNLSIQKFALESFREHLSVMQERLWDQYKTTAGTQMLDQIADQELKSRNLAGRADQIIQTQIFDWEGSGVDSITVYDSLKQALLVLHAGLVAIDPTTGDVRAWVGGIDFKTQPYDQVNASRQMASVFKPILYAEAFEEGIDPCRYLDNDSIETEGMEGWSPENFDHSTGGKYSVAGALANSMNIPTFNLFMNIDFGKLDSLWKRLGFTYPLTNNPSLPLGTAEASILETALAYSGFVNGGRKVEPQSIISIKTPEGEIIYQNEFSSLNEIVMTDRSAALISAILQKAINEGTGASMRSLYGVNLPLAGKTGTSQDYSDAWFAAFNPNLVIVSRVGASSRAIHFNNGSFGSGSTLALPLVALTLQKVQADKALTKQFFTQFPPLPAELEGVLDCPDFKEETLIDRFKSIFENKTVTPELVIKKTEQKKKSLFERIFGK